MGTDVNGRDAVIEHARGILAERFGVAISTADKILQDCAHAQGQGLSELAMAIVASCTTDSAPLPRRLYWNGETANEAA
ncbi:MAG: ANTAR domain-containing protein [Gaiellaceae bacterium]